MKKMILLFFSSLLSLFLTGVVVEYSGLARSEAPAMLFVVFFIFVFFTILSFKIAERFLVKKENVTPFKKTVPVIWLALLAPILVWLGIMMLMSLR